MKLMANSRRERQRSASKGEKGNSGQCRKKREGKRIVKAKKKEKRHKSYPPNPIINIKRLNEIVIRRELALTNTLLPSARRPCRVLRDTDIVAARRRTQLDAIDGRVEDGHDGRCRDGDEDGASGCIVVRGGRGRGGGDELEVGVGAA